MASNYGSPGVYINEVDKSYYETPKTRSISITLLGPAQRGEFNTPTNVESVTDFVNKFGEPIEKAGLCATLCLNQASTVKFVRLSSLDPETETNTKREVKIDGAYVNTTTATTDVANGLVFTNAETGAVSNWTLTFTADAENPDAFNILFKKGDDTVYDSSTDSAVAGPFDPSADNFATIMTGATNSVASKCGCTVAIAEGGITRVVIGDSPYTFTGGGEDVAASATIPAQKDTTTTTTVERTNALVITAKEIGTIDGLSWTATIKNSNGTNFDLDITKLNKTNRTEVIYSSTTDRRLLNQPLSMDATSANYIGNLTLTDFDITLNLGDPKANNIPNVEKTFSDGSNLWEGGAGDVANNPNILKGLDTISDREIVTTEVVAAPDLHDIDYLKELTRIAELRKDIIVILDIPHEKAEGVEMKEADAVEYIEDINSCYVATYYPWVYINNSYSNSEELVPPSVVMLPAMMREYITYPRWTAPAGIPRLELVELVRYGKVLTQSSRDVVYTGGINPLCNYKNLGNTAMGQKTLLRENAQGLTSSLDRLNVRLLVNYIKVNVELISASYIFSTIDQQTMDSWVLEVGKFLDSIKNQRGIYDYRVNMSWNTVTPENLNNNTMPGVIQIKPSRVAEFIPIDVVILNRDDEFLS